MHALNVTVLVSSFSMGSNCQALNDSSTQFVGLFTIFAYAPTSCNLPDPARRVTAAWPSPCGRLIVTADDYGRVLLLDAMEFVVLRIWKGYRNAQCGWIEVGKEEAQAGGNEERGSSGEERKEAAKGGGRRCAQTALCLCIFASRRGILEVSVEVAACSCVQQVCTGLLCLVVFCSFGLFSMAQRLPRFKWERPAGEWALYMLPVRCTFSKG